MGHAPAAAGVVAGNNDRLIGWVFTARLYSWQPTGVPKPCCLIKYLPDYFLHQLLVRPLRPGSLPASRPGTLQPLLALMPIARSRSFSFSASGGRCCDAGAACSEPGCAAPPLPPPPMLASDMKPVCS
jgi:hypothetical protein